jgi:hypothetical protein
VKFDLRRVSIFADDWTPGRGIELYIEIWRLCFCLNLGVKRETRRHPETGKLLRRDVRPEVRRDGRTVMLPGWYADGDDNGIHTGRDLKVME